MAGEFGNPEIVQEEVDILMIGGGMANCGAAYEIQRWADAAASESGVNLKIIARGGVGLDNIDVEHAESKGIFVLNTPAASSQSVAELAFAHMFSLSRFLYQSNRTMPVNRAYPLAELMAAVRRWPLKPREKLTFEYVLED